MAKTELGAAFGQALRELREARGISQEALALAAGVDRSYLSEIECGQSQPGLGTVFKLAAALQIPPSTLIAHAERLLR